MKKYFLFWLLLSSLGALYAQVSNDCVQGISTDPDNPVKSNPTDPVYHVNTFDWRQPSYPVPSAYCPGYGPLLNPFYFVGPGQPMGAVQKNALSDFQPADGWELIKRDMGYLMRSGQMTLPSPNPSLMIGTPFSNPYLMLYNRHRGVLRIIAALPFNQPGQEIEVDLSGLAVGLYSAVFTTGTQRGTTKVVVQR